MLWELLVLHKSHIVEILSPNFIVLLVLPRTVVPKGCAMAH